MSTNDRDGVAPADEGRAVHGVSRRGFARAGLTSGVLLGSLASKPVLGASVGCTVSGQMSGNLSREKLTFDCRVGKSPASWLNDDWPQGFSKGTLEDGCTVNGETKPVNGTVFNGWTSGDTLIGAFFLDGNCKVVTDASSGLSATMFQVLNTADASEEFALGRIVVASLLNIAEFPDYPVTSHTVIAMFNATFGGGDYEEGGKQWSRTRVIDYLESLVQ